MKRFLLAALLVLTAAAAAAPDAHAKGLNAAVQGATVNGLPYRYVAISPNSPYRASAARPSDKFTVIGRIDKQGGRIGRWWYLPAGYSIPAAAYDDTAGGLSADGGTLVLSRFSWIYPPRTTGLAILDTNLINPHPRRGQQRPRHAFRRVSLAGGFSFDAISPDGSTIYLIEHLSPVFGGAYQVRALTKSGKLLPEPIVDPAEPMERMEGVPISRTTSPDGRWAYTLYSGYESRRSHADRAREPFIHALDTVARRAVCIDLPQLEGRADPFLLALRTEQRGRRLLVLNRRPGLAGSRALLTVDTGSFKVQKLNPVAAASSGVGPWPPIAVLSAGAMLLLAWIGIRQRRRDGGLTG